MKGLRAAIRLNHWEIDTVKPFKCVKGELTIGPNNIVLHGTWLVLPASLRQRAIDIAHESHQGLSKTKALMREKVWFPEIDKLTKETLDGCIPCQAVGRPAPPQSLQMSEMPIGPWQKAMPTSEYLLVVIDRYSQCPIVEMIKSTKAKSIIPKLDKTFAVHGLSVEVTTDNGPPFNSDDFTNCMSQLCIDYKPTTPRGLKVIQKHATSWQSYSHSTSRREGMATRTTSLSSAIQINTSLYYQSSAGRTYVQP